MDYVPAFIQPEGYRVWLRRYQRQIYAFEADAVIVNTYKSVVSISTFNENVTVVEAKSLMIARIVPEQFVKYLDVDNDSYNVDRWVRQIHHLQILHDVDFFELEGDTALSRIYKDLINRLT